MWIRRLLILALLATTALSAAAFERTFPASAKRGKMTPANFPAIVIDGKQRALSPAARIFNQDNLIEMPASLRGSNMPVNYTETGDGDIDRVWILSAEEASQKLAPQPQPLPFK